MSYTYSAERDDINGDVRIHERSPEWIKSVRVFALADGTRPEDIATLGRQLIALSEEMEPRYKVDPDGGALAPDWWQVTDRTKGVVAYFADKRAAQDYADRMNDE